MRCYTFLCARENRVLHLLFSLLIDFLLHFDYPHPSGTILDLFGTRVEHDFAPLWTIWSGFESSHNNLGTNLGCFFTFLDGMMAHH